MANLQRRGYRVWRQSIPELIQTQKVLDDENRPDGLAGARTSAVLYPVDEPGTDAVHQVAGQPRRDYLPTQFV
jgi:hypothetical protein